MKRIEYLYKIVGTLAVIFLVLWLLEISPEMFRLVIGNIYSPKASVNFTSYFLWKARFIDTLVQGIVILAGLFGVLIYVLRGEKR